MSNLLVKKTFFVRFLICLCAIGFVVIQKMRGNGQFSAAQKETVEYHQQRVLRFVYEITNETPNAIDDSKFSTYLPVRTLSNQQAISLKSSIPYIEETGQSGNRIGRFELGLIPPFGKKQLVISAGVEMAIKANPLSIKNHDKYLQSEEYIEVNHPEITALAKKLAGETEIESLKKVYNWVSVHVKYAGYVSKDKGALDALTTKRGDCTEYAYLVIALARAMNIPARAIGGYVYGNNKIVSASDYHNWAEVYLEGKWQIIDAQKKSFMKGVENYIALRVIEPSDVSLLGSTHRFAVASEGLKVKLRD